MLSELHVCTMYTVCSLLFGFPDVMIHSELPTYVGRDKAGQFSGKIYTLQNEATLMSISFLHALFVAVEDSLKTFMSEDKMHQSTPFCS